MKIGHVDTNVHQTSDDAVTRVLIFLNLLRAIPPGRLLDLGAGHCKFSLWAQRLGFDVTAVDARTDRVPSRENLGSIKFFQSDVREFDFAGFDVILYLGLIYHLNIADQLATLQRCAEARATVILDTQVHIADRVPAELDEPWARKSVERDGYVGVEFPERDNLMASIGNRFSFWHTENSWLRLFEDAEFAEATIITPLFQTKYGARGFYVLK